MFCTFIFAVLLLKYFFPTSDQLQRYCASDISYSSQVAYSCYLLLAPHLQILEIFRVIGAKPHHHGKVAERTECNTYLLQLNWAPQERLEELSCLSDILSSRECSTTNVGGTFWLLRQSESTAYYVCPLFGVYQSNWTLVICDAVTV